MAFASMTVFMFNVNPIANSIPWCAISFKCTVWNYFPNSSLYMLYAINWISVQRESYLLHVKDTLVDFEKKSRVMPLQAALAPASGKGLI